MTECDGADTEDKNGGEMCASCATTAASRIFPPNKASYNYRKLLQTFKLIAKNLRNSFEKHREFFPFSVQYNSDCSTGMDLAL